MKTCIAILLCSGLVSLATSTEMKRDATCFDAIPNCDHYDPSECTRYQRWASKNCNASCNMCANQPGGAPVMAHIGGGFSPVCVDSIPTCELFDPSICSMYQYHKWATDNCARTCNVCSNGGPVAGNVTGTGTVNGTGSGGTTTGSSSGGCNVGYRIFQQGQTWKIGCQKRCTCVDGVSGKTECKKLCFDWNLPPVCYMEPPTLWKCCPIPRCPSNYPINYPPGYIEE